MIAPVPRLVSNPPNPWRTTEVEWLGEPPVAGLEVFEERARSVLSRNDSPDVPFRWSVNPYRGCFHGCAYCYARPTHQYLGWGAGSDFERKIVAKINAPQILARQLGRRGWKRETILFSGNTDAWQPLEASYGLARACLEVCRDHAQPVAIITKGALVARDAELIAALHRRAGAQVTLSLSFADSPTARRVEPHTSSPARRLEALRRIAALGVPTGIAISPVVPGLSESHVPELLERAAQAGARSASLTLLRLPKEVEAVFRERLTESAPERVGKVFAALRDMRGGKTSESAFGERMRGRGPRWQLVVDLFELHCRRLGLRVSETEIPVDLTPPRPRQGTLFDSSPGSRGRGT